MVALVGSTLVLGCGRVAPTTSSEPGPTSVSAAPTAAASASTWADACTRQVGYWVVRLLDEPDHSYDYQEMGLSGRTYEALRDVMRDAEGGPRSSAWVERRSAAVCAAQARRHTEEPTSANGWP